MVQRVKESERTERICLHCEILTLLWHGDFANPIPLLGISSLARDWSFEEKWTKRVFKTSPARYDRVNVTRTAMVSMAQWRIKNRLTHWILGSWIHGMIWMVMVYDDLWSGYVWICLDGMALDHFGSFWMMILRQIQRQFWTIPSWRFPEVWKVLWTDHQGGDPISWLTLSSLCLGFF